MKKRRLLSFLTLFFVILFALLNESDLLTGNPLLDKPVVTVIPRNDSIQGATTSAIFYPVIKIVDGDTITVLQEDEKKTIRLIGINTPETVDPRKGVECFGKEASEKVKQLLTGKQVQLLADETQTNVDRYGRLLRYVYLPDGTFLNKLLIEEGYAYEYTYDVPYIHQDIFKKAQDDAKIKQKGLWGTICQ